MPPLPGRNPSPWQCVQEVFASAIVSDRFQFLSNLNVLPGLPFNPKRGRPDETVVQCNADYRLVNILI
jgi:hypothetical protein